MLSHPIPRREGMVRAAGLFVLWVVLMGGGLGDAVVGAVTALFAAGVSLWLLPPGDWHPRPLPMAKFALHFLRQSAVAGVDVAWRALDPKLPLRPGFVVCPVRLRFGSARNLFCTITSLMPGTVPSGSEPGGGLLVHCLDTRQPVAADLAMEETLLAGALLDPSQLDGTENGSRGAGGLV